MKIRNYSVSEDTAALLTCLEELTTAHEHIYEALTQHWGTEQVEQEDGVGSEIFNKLMEVRDEIFKVMQDTIEENLSSISADKKI